MGIWPQKSEAPFVLTSRGSAASSSAEPRSSWAAALCRNGACVMVTLKHLVGETASFNERFWGHECLHRPRAFDPKDLWDVQQFWDAMLSPGTIDQERVRISGIE